MPVEIGKVILYSLKELSPKLRVSEVTLRRYLREGKLQGKKIGTTWYVSEEALQKDFAGGAENRGGEPI